MTKIEWTTVTWNPVVGCSRVSEGCRNCYAEPQSYHNGACGTPQYKGLTKKTKSGEIRWTGVVRFVKSELDKPLHWKKPSRIFVNSMSDLFHEKVEDEWIDRIVAVMAKAPQHTFQILTKRPERMLQWVTRSRPLPLPNVWLGVSVEDQETADERIPLLMQTPAAIRWVSYEPALGPVDFRRWTGPDNRSQYAMIIAPPDGRDKALIDWIVVGGESGPGARPFDLAWARQTLAQCRAAGIAVFVKQMGSRPIVRRHPGPRDGWAPVTGQNGQPIRLKSTKGGDITEWPTALRVREYPSAGAAATAEPRVRLIRTPGH